MRKLKTASTFSHDEWEALAWAYLFFLKFQLILPFYSIQLVEKSASKNCRARTGKMSLFLTKKRLLDLFRIAWRYQLKKPRCLVISLAKQAFLFHYGFSSAWRIGVKKEGGRLSAHAWCEDPKQNRYQSLEPLHS